MRKIYAALVSLALGAVACVPPDEQHHDSLRCKAPAEYLAFDPANHAPQDLRLLRMDEMLAKFSEAQAAPATAAAKAAEIRAIYEATDANLAAKFAGRQDVHLSGDAALVGPALDASLRGAIADLEAATTVTDVKLAKQRFEKDGLYRFLYLSVMQELYEPSFKHYDEAYGYLGSGPTNAEAGQRGLARLATKRDAANGTTLNAELFALVLDGACAIETAMEGRSTLGLNDDATYRQGVDALDQKLQLVFAYSIGHELFELPANRSNPAEARVKMVEGRGFFVTLKPYLSGQGTAKANLGASLQAAFDAAQTKIDAGDADWVNSFPAESLLLELEAAYGIDVKG